MKYHGKYYPGRHEPIISEDLCDRVEAILAAHKLAGERDRKHSHYLKGSIFCGACGGRLTYSRNTGNGGTFEYFVCLGNQRHKCAERLDAVEAAIENHYRTIAATDDDRERVRTAVEQKLSEMTETSTQETERCKALLADLKIQERKLMEKDYRDEISAEPFSEESVRIRRERLDATAVVDRLNVHHGEIQDALALVLSIFRHDIHDLYLRATPTQRRFINQAIFKAIWLSQRGLPAKHAIRSDTRRQRGHPHRQSSHARTPQGPEKPSSRPQRGGIGSIGPWFHYCIYGGRNWAARKPGADDCGAAGSRVAKARKARSSPPVRGRAKPLDHPLETTTAHFDLLRH